MYAWYSRADECFFISATSGKFAAVATICEPSCARTAITQELFADTRTFQIPNMSDTKLLITSIVRH
jgi:hypothetical protein